MPIKSYPKKPPFRSNPYLAWLRKQRPICAGYGSVEIHHLKMLGHSGTGIKSPDNEGLPVFWSVHKDIHNQGEKTILCEREGFTKDQLKELCDLYYQSWLNRKKTPDYMDKKQKRLF